MGINLLNSSHTQLLQFTNFFQCCTDGTASNDVLITTSSKQSQDDLISDVDLQPVYTIIV